MIPKIIHYIWLSNDPLSNGAQKCIESWMKNAPEYKIKRWSLNDFNLDELPLFVCQAIRIKKWAFACDYLRAYVLYREGGVYLDSDVFMIGNIEDYLKHDFVSSVEYYEELFDEDARRHVDINGDADIDMVKGIALNAAMMASIKNHPLLKDILDYYQNIDFIHDDGSLHTKMLAPHIYALVARKYGFKYQNRIQELEDDVYLYPSDVFAQSFNGITNKTILVHMCAASWRDNLSRRYVKQIDNQINYLSNRDFNRPFLSIVVLCYKVEKYLPQCLESIRRQTFKDFEVIIVDDGSPDNCGKIGDAYCAMDQRFKIIHKKNGGIIAARKDALKMARGYFVGSVDGDDWISLDMYQNMYEAQTSFNVDLVQVGFSLNYTEHIVEKSRIGDGFFIFLEEDQYKKEIRSGDYLSKDIIEVSLCRSILKRDMLLEIMNKLDDSCSLCEDAVCMFIYAAKINNLCIINKNFYHYRIRKNSCTSSIKTRNVDHLYELFDLAKRELKDDSLYTPIIRRLGIYFIQHLITSFLMNVKGKDNPRDLLVSYVNDSRFKDISSMYSNDELVKLFNKKQLAVINNDDFVEEVIKKTYFAGDGKEAFD